jgi:hypothetical protein
MIRLMIAAMVFALTAQGVAYAAKKPAPTPPPVVDAPVAPTPKDEKKEVKAEEKAEEKEAKAEEKEAKAEEKEERREARTLVIAAVPLTPPKHQAVPMPKAGCDAVDDAELGYGTGLTGGWQRGWETWRDSDGEVVFDGWACVRAFAVVDGRWRLDQP